MSKSYNGLNLLDFRVIAYAQWLLGHSDKLPALQLAGAALISELSTVKQRAIAVRDVLDILITIIDDAPGEIFGAEGDAPKEVFTELADSAEKEGLNVLLMIEIISLVMKFLKRK